MNRRLDTAVCHQFGSQLPILAFSHSLPVTAAATNCGAIGIWGATRNTPEEIDEGLAWLAARCGGRPYGVDLVLPANMPERDNRELLETRLPQCHRDFVAALRTKYAVPDDGLPGTRSRFVRSQEMAHAQLGVVLASEAPITAMGVGSPPEAVSSLHDAGKSVISLVGTTEHARRALDAGTDMLVAQGYDAGAHTGDIGTFSLVPQIVDLAGDIPVVAAGGVATGRHLAAALAMGACGVWMGTAWLFAKEHDLDPLVLAKLAAADSGDTIRSRADSGKTLRQITTAWTDEWSEPGAPEPLAMPLQDILVGDLLGAVSRHRIEPLMKSEAGQSVGYFRERTDVASILDGLITEAVHVLDRLGSDI
ncbi:MULTISPECIES: NAD(P)H-dependent flavin oxidoreductase [Rhodococcus]|uniref:Putative oxidoreductase n=1 Tax=Rhodococcus wratislaviensis NBRC 100605 TaxID=1219028 RepID=X0PX77_RHOWR|nr:MULTISPECIES: nitronate monooxygenase [Rhodococcus]WAM14664.1 nitronate monooxygenase [Rhodococcus sp. JS3073]GAF42927.1 putative oxidoreductase [Rhodococcus wratislaviensis NBRC 100605]